jgi:hypothetical protein
MPLVDPLWVQVARRDANHRVVVPSALQDQTAAFPSWRIELQSKIPHFKHGIPVNVAIASGPHHMQDVLEDADEVVFLGREFDRVKFCVNVRFDYARLVYFPLTSIIVAGLYSCRQRPFC